MGKEKKKKFLGEFEQEEKVEKNGSKKEKIFNVFKKKKINSSDEFQINLSSESSNNKDEKDFGYNEFDENQASVNNIADDTSPSPAESSGYIPNEKNNEDPEYNNYSANNMTNITSGNNNYEEDYNELYNESNDEGSDIYLPSENEPLDNGDERIKKLSEAYKKSRKPQNCFVVLIMVIIALIGLFFNGVALIVGGVISFISVFGAIFKYQDRVKYSKPLLYLAIIVLVGYAFTFVYVKNVFNSVDEVKALAFKDKAIKFIEKVRDDDIDKDRKLKCVAKGVKKANFILPEYDSDAYNSPFGNSFNKDDSYVLVEAEMIEGKCTYRYSIYLTDNSYQLGTLYAPIEENNIENSKVTKR